MAGSLTARRTRRQHVTKFRLHKPRWVDPFPWIPGTEPEKRIFAALVMRRIYFVFQEELPESVKGVYVTLQQRDFIPDFVLPEYKVIIDPFSEFHHSLPDAVRRDAWKFVVYEALGYKFYHPWSDEVIEKGGLGILLEIPELWQSPKFKLTEREDKVAKLNPGYRIGKHIGAGANSVAAANRKRKRPPVVTLRTRRSRPR